MSDKRRLAFRTDNLSANIGSHPTRYSRDDPRFNKWAKRFARSSVTEEERAPGILWIRQASSWAVGLRNSLVFRRELTSSSLVSTGWTGNCFIGIWQGCWRSCWTSKRFRNWTGTIYSSVASLLILSVSLIAIPAISQEKRYRRLIVREIIPRIRWASVSTTDWIVLRPDVDG